MYLDGDETVRLIRYEIYKLMYNRIKNMNITKIPEQIKIHAGLIKNKLAPAIRYSHIKTDLPPCIKKGFGITK